MTRSRRHTHIVTSIHPKDTELRRLQHGAKDMYHMLEVLFGEETTSERAPAPVDDPGAATDALVADLARRLRAAGATVHTGYAHAVDMAAHADAESLSAGWRSCTAGTTTLPSGSPWPCSRTAPTAAVP